MSYGEQVRGELSRVEIANRCCRLAELVGLVDASGEWKPPGLAWYTGSASLARRLFRFLKAELDLRTVITRTRRPRRGRGYHLWAADYDPVAHQELRRQVLDRLPTRRCCRKAYLRGFFLGRGSINDPGRGHHLELTTPQEDAAQLLMRLMRDFQLPASVVRRKGDWVVYLKDAESIVTFLNLIGAHSCLMQFENIRAYKDLKGRVNRLVNMETANLERTVQASVQQLQAIETIDQCLGLHRLPSSLAQVAWARQHHPELSLEELGLAMLPPLSKSAVNHRLRRLVALARRLRALGERVEG